MEKKPRGLATESLSVWRRGVQKRWHDAYGCVENDTWRWWIGCSSMKQGESVVLLNGELCLVLH